MESGSRSNGGDSDCGLGGGWSFFGGEIDLLFWSEIIDGCCSQWW